MTRRTWGKEIDTAGRHKTGKLEDESARQLPGNPRKNWIFAVWDSDTTLRQG